MEDIRKDSIDSLNYESSLMKINTELKELRHEVNMKMDRYFIEEEKDVYETMMKYSQKSEKK